VIPIDISKVPIDKHTHPDFLGLKKEMEQALTQQSWISAFCIHEAGHMIYLTQIGITDYTYFGPRIEYDQQQDKFEGYMAAVQPQSGAIPENVNLSEYLATAAKAYAAGGTFAKKLTGASDQGDEEDRENLNSLCTSLEQKCSGIAIDRDSSWKQAQNDVLIDLRSPSFRTTAWEKAREIQKKLFGF
jgi:hypothetical protein